jgi:hypothetical protein
MSYSKNIKSIVYFTDKDQIIIPSAINLSVFVDTLLAAMLLDAGEI